MSFDLYLEHFAAGESAPTDPTTVAAVLARRRHTGPDDFGFCGVEFEDGTSVEFNAGGLASREPFSGCAFHIRAAGHLAVRVLCLKSHAPGTSSSSTPRVTTRLIRQY